MTLNYGARPGQGLWTDSNRPAQRLSIYDIACLERKSHHACSEMTISYMPRLQWVLQPPRSFGKYLKIPFKTYIRQIAQRYRCLPTTISSNTAKMTSKIARKTSNTTTVLVETAVKSMEMTTSLTRRGKRYERRRIVVNGHDDKR